MNEETKEKLYRMHKCWFTKKLRRRMTPEEEILWRLLRNRRCRGLKFRRQVNIGPYIVDFLCKEHRVIIEVDGGIHNKRERKEYDHFRDAFLCECGYNILRITNDEIYESLPLVLNKINDFINLNKQPFDCAQDKQTTYKNSSPLLEKERG